MKLSLKLAISALTLASATPALAQYFTASTTAASSATVIQPITLTKTSDLSFGALVRPSLGINVIRVDEASGLRSVSGSGDAALRASSASRAAYSVSGEGGASFSIDMPSSISLTRTGGTETLPMTLSASTPSRALSGAPGTSGTANIGVGGSLPLTASTVPGAYSGVFDVTVGYN